MNRTRTVALVLLLAALALVAAGCASGTSKAPAAASKPVIVEIYAGGVPHGVGDSLAKGQTIRVRDTGVVIGTIESVRITPFEAANPDAAGKLVASGSPVLDQVVLTVKGTAAVSDAGYSFGGSFLYANDDQEFITPTTILRGVIVSMRPGS